MDAAEWGSEGWGSTSSCRADQNPDKGDEQDDYLLRQGAREASREMSTSGGDERMMMMTMIVDCFLYILQR